MPLPSIINGAKQCQVMTKRTKQRCKNLAAYGCTSCRMHGAHKSKNVLRGKDHPQYKNGKQTKEAKAFRSRKSTMFLYLRDIGDSINLFSGEKTRGRKPIGYVKLDMTDPEQLAIAIVKSLQD